MKVQCPDCQYIVEPIKDFCHVHPYCGEYAYICPECSSLNVDCIVRSKK